MTEKPNFYYKITLWLTLLVALGLLIYVTYLITTNGGMCVTNPIAYASKINDANCMCLNNFLG